MISRDNHLPTPSTECPSSSLASPNHRFFSRPASLPMTPADSYRESFIELCSPVSSPSSPSFPPHDHRSHAELADSPPCGSLVSYAEKIKALPILPVSSSRSKPPVPTAPKPAFSRRSLSMRPPAHRSSFEDSASNVLPNHAVPPRDCSPLPFHHSRGRIELIKQTRKLTQLFGQTPGNIEATTSRNQSDTVSPRSICSATNGGVSLGASDKHKHQWNTTFMSVGDPSGGAGRLRAAWPPPEGTIYLSLSDTRRHSSPLMTREFTLPDASTGGARPQDREAEGLDFGSTDHTGNPASQKRAASYAGSQISFMDLSDEDVTVDAHSVLSLELPTVGIKTSAPFSSSTPSLLESVSSDERVEEERRRKREKLAKLHRFLGSRVPVGLVLAQIEDRSTKPAVPLADTPPRNYVGREPRIRRRRSSSAAEFGGTWSDDIDRLKEELNEREKAINVRRAVKMEKMFGVAPPQTLYHTRKITNLSTILPPNDGHPTPSQGFTTSALPSRETAPPKKHTTKHSRSGTAESLEPLINSCRLEGATAVHGLSDIYLHYHHSLNSLNDIIDRDDKESLVDLHDYLHGSVTEVSLAPPPSLREATVKTDRRRSLPVRTSRTSLDSEFSATSINSLQIQDPSFQTRRRRAAKLTQFFGVNYRDLMAEILDKIERGVEEEGGRGRLEPEEVQDLLHKLWKLKNKRSSIS